VTDPPLAGRRPRTARPCADAPDDGPGPDPPIPSAAELARIRCPRCHGTVDLQALQAWDPYRLLILCRDPACGLIHIRTPGDGGRRRTYTVALDIPPLRDVGLRPQLVPDRDPAAIAARDILSYSAPDPLSSPGSSAG